MKPAECLKRAHALRVELHKHTAYKRDVLIAQLIADVRREALADARGIVRSVSTLSEGEANLRAEIERELSKL